jgi:hypothetical protein
VQSLQSLLGLFLRAESSLSTIETLRKRNAMEVFSPQKHRSIEAHSIHLIPPNTDGSSQDPLKFQEYEDNK